MRTVQQRAAAGAFVVFAGVAMGQVGFWPASEVSPIAPPPNQSALNAAQVILGMADRYIVALGTPPADHAAVTTDFVTFTPLPAPASAIRTIPVAVTDDGVRVLGQIWFPSAGGSTGRTCVWDGSGDPQVLSYDAAFSQGPIGMSTDGVRWVVQTGISSSERSYMVDGGVSQSIIPNPDDEEQLTTHASALSPDGRTVAGSYNGPQGVTFLWSKADGGSLLARPYQERPFPTLVADGAARVVARPLANGQGAPTYAGGRWRLMPGFTGTAMSRDGRLVLGTTTAVRAAVWSETLGVSDLGEALRARGIDTRGWTLTSVSYISSDARTIVGQGRRPGTSALLWWVANVEPFAAADVGTAGGHGGSDGKLDNNDFIVFIDRFFAQDERADVGRAGGERGPDGVFDNNDFCAFINLFFTGVP